ncbi:hypothetical protein V6N13_016680 [Hibiscus sabdariffa]
MRVLSWNLRGMGSEAKISAVRKVIRDNRVDMAMFQETKKEKVTEGEISKMWVDDEFEFVVAASSGKSGGLLTIWDKTKFKLESSVINSSEVEESEDNIKSLAWGKGSPE